MRFPSGASANPSLTPTLTAQSPAWCWSKVSPALSPGPQPKRIGRHFHRRRQLQQATHELRTVSLTQSGGLFSGGSAPLTIDGSAHVGLRTVQHAFRRDDVERLDIGTPAVVRIGANGELSEHLGRRHVAHRRWHAGYDDRSSQQRGIDRRRFRRPAGIRADGGVQAGYRQDSLPIDIDSARNAGQQSATTAGQTDSLTLADDFNFWSAVIDTDNGYAYFGTWTSGHYGSSALWVGLHPRRHAHLRQWRIRPALGRARLGERYAYFGAYTEPGVIVDINLGHLHT